MAQTITPTAISTAAEKAAAEAAEQNKIHIEFKWWWVAAAFGIILVLFVAIAMMSTPTELELVTSYEFPEFESAETFKELDGVYAIAVDGDVVYTSSEEQRPTASTAKMILGLSVMQTKPFALGEEGETIKISEEYYNLYKWYAEHNGSNTAVEVGEEISEYDALASVFLPSSNNMADTLAQWAFGSLNTYGNYAAEMLHQWDIRNTTMGIDASGFDESTKSTVADLARIGYLVLDQPVLAEIVGLKEHEVPVAGTISNTNALLGKSGVVGVKTGYIGDTSGYCLVSGYRTDGHIITVALTGAETRAESFDESLEIIKTAQTILYERALAAAEQEVGYYDSWWTGKVPIRTAESLDGIGWLEAPTEAEIIMGGKTGSLTLSIDDIKYSVEVKADDFATKPNFWERFLHVFGWRKN